MSQDDLWSKSHFLNRIEFCHDDVEKRGASSGVAMKPISNGFDGSSRRMTMRNRRSESTSSYLFGRRLLLYAHLFFVFGGF
jgi:hypothetical protein